MTISSIPTITHVVAVGVADVRRDPDATSELVTQALLNMPVAAGETSGDWTHSALTDYSGWIRSSALEEPAALAPDSRLFAVVNTTHARIFDDEQGSHTSGTVYLSTALPLLDTTWEQRAQRVRVALPGERSAWLEREAVALREQDALYPRSTVRAVTDYARMFLGVPYLWGGTSWEGIDCSGFVQLCYRMGGYHIPRDADQQHDFLSHSIERPNMQEGDLIFFGAKAITHVGLALNNSEYIHAEGQNYNRVLINSFNPTDAHYYPRLDDIVWAIKRVV